MDKVNLMDYGLKRIMFMKMLWFIWLIGCQDFLGKETNSYISKFSCSQLIRNDAWLKTRHLGFSI
jgi:hypothetical protein